MLSKKLLTLLLITGAAFAADPIIIPFKRFSMEVSATSPVTRVDVFYTTDSGINWNLYYSKEPATSTLPIKVSKDGTYGFYTCFYGTQGSHDPKPVSGTEPQVVAIIDTVNPTIQAEHKLSESELIIDWKAEDDNFNLFPVELFRVSGGQLTKVSKALPPSGNLTLPLEPNQSFLLKATDLAGNSSNVHLKQKA